MKKFIAALAILLLLLSMGAGLVYAQQPANNTPRAVTNPRQLNPNSDQSSQPLANTDASAENTTAGNTQVNPLLGQIRAARQRLQARHNATKERGATRVVPERQCAARAIKLNNLMDRLTAVAEKHLVVFDTASQRVQQFYTKHQLAIDNYQELIADIDAKQLLAKEAVALLKASQDEFDCTGSDPKAPLATYKEGLHTTITTLRDYRVSIKNLITAIKLALGETYE